MGTVSRLSVDHRLSVAGRFASDRAAIFRSYESRLRALGSALVADPGIWAECQLLADLVVSNCALSLHQGEVVLGTGYLPRAAGLGSACVASGIDLREAVRAATELYEAVSDALAGAGVRRPDQAALRRVALATLGRSITGFVQAVWSWYEMSPVGQITTAQLGSRQWLAREIHDWVGNSASLAIRHLDLYEIYREQEPAAAEGRLVELRRTLDELLAGTRQLVSSLRQPRAEVGLGAALRSYVRAVGSTGAAVDVVVHGDETLVPEDYRDELLAVTREALRNALAHARASTIVATVDITPASVWVAVEDDGVGFDPDAVPAALRGAGLASMGERTRLLGGELAITRPAAGGTHVRISIPLRGHRHVDVR
jgi:signal transduction histidine kinase